jgi:hypothetical protein
LANFHSHPCIFPSRHSLFSLSSSPTHIASAQGARLPSSHGAQACSSPRPARARWPLPYPFFLVHAASPSLASPSRSSRRHLLPWIPHASNREHGSFSPWPDRPPPAAGRQQLDIFNLGRELPPRLLPAQLGALAAGEQQLPGSMAPVKLEQPSSQLWRPLPAGMQFPWSTPSGAAMAELPGSTPVPLLSPWPPAAMAASPRRARVLLPGRPAPCPRRLGIPIASSPFPKLLLPWPILPCAQLLLAMCPTPLAAQLLHDAVPLFLQPRPLPRLPCCQRCARATCSTKCPSGVLHSEQHAVMPPPVFAIFAQSQHRRRSPR